MPVLPTFIRHRLFDRLSRKTMHYVTALPYARTNELGREVYRQIRRDFFVNGSLTSRSSVPEIFAATWSLGREAILVADQLDKTTKEAMAATLSSVNDCPYCGDMLVSLVDAAEEREIASAIFHGQEHLGGDQPLMRRLRWVRELASNSAAPAAMATPFSAAQLPEALASLLAMSDINRFSHVVMKGSPVAAPFGSRRLKLLALRRFAGELVPTQRHRLAPGASLGLLPAAALPADLAWAAPNARLANTVAAVAAVVEQQAASAIDAPVRARVGSVLSQWRGQTMPLGRHWLEQEVAGLRGADADIARLALLLAKASYQLDDALVERIRANCGQEDFVRILSWCSFTSARHQVANIVEHCLEPALKAA